MSSSLFQLANLSFSKGMLSQVRRIGSFGHFQLENLSFSKVRRQIFIAVILSLTLNKEMILAPQESVEFKTPLPAVLDL